MATTRDSSGSIVSSDGAGSLSALPYSASITPNGDFASVFTIVVTNGTGFTINAPSRPVVGRVITFDILNSSGGAMGTVTWDAVYKKGAFTAPGNGLRTTWSFYYDGTNWVAVGAQSLAS
jgi:hypothetical protein